jgi:radical SAM superfamily enzyme YgiQ (UPF0313 family)
VKALLINPNYGETFWSFKYALKIVGKRAVMPPLGLLTMAALLPAAWEKRLADLNARPLPESDLAWADIVFITSYQIQEASAREIIARCRRAGLKIVAGGPLYLMEHQTFPEVDHFVLREAELTLPLFLKDLAAGKAKRLYTTDQWADLEKSPVPLWPAARLDDYFMLNVQFSRGCPHHCEFCGITFLDGRLLRTKNAGQILAELEVFYRAGWRYQVMFVDDNFIGHRQRLKREILPALAAWMKEKKYPFNFLTQASLDIADDQDLMDKMVLAGFDTVFIGVESLNDGSLEECGKSQNRNRDMFASVKRIQASGLQVQGGFLVGFDQDPPEVFRQQAEFVQATGIATAMMNMLKPMPGTRFFERLKKEGRLRTRSFQGEFTAGVLEYVPKTMTPEELVKGFRDMVAWLYAPARYFARLKNFLAHYRQRSPAGPPPVRLSSLVTTLRVFTVLGILARERRTNWKFFLWCLVNHPRRLRLAVTLAVFGYNYRRHYEEIFGRRVM